MDYTITKSAKKVPFQTGKGLIVPDVNKLVLFCLTCGIFRVNGRLEALDFLGNDTGQSQHADQVRNCHQCVGNIGQIPYQIQRHGSAEECNDREDMQMERFLTMYSSAFSP